MKIKCKEYIQGQKDYMRGYKFDENLFSPVDTKRKQRDQWRKGWKNARNKFKK